MTKCLCTACVAYAQNLTGVQEVWDKNISGVHMLYSVDWEPSSGLTCKSSLFLDSFCQILIFKVLSKELLVLEFERKNP